MEGFGARGFLRAGSVPSLRTRNCVVLRTVRGVENTRSLAIDGRIGGHDPPRFAGGFPSHYGHRLLPVCCPTAPTADLRDHNLIRLCALCSDGPAGPARHRPCRALAPLIGTREHPLRDSAGPSRLTSRRGRREQHLDPAANASGRGPGVD